MKKILKTWAIIQEQYNVLNSNPVLVSRHFQYKVEIFFNEIVLDEIVGKTKYYALHISEKG